MSCMRVCLRASVRAQRLRAFAGAGLTHANPQKMDSLTWNIPKPTASIASSTVYEPATPGLWDASCLISVEAAMFRAVSK